jgi:flavin reductase (DIM6/NTAB) family NADH-FMN oxidoreductase RutF
MSQVSLASGASISAAEELDIATFRAAMRELAGGVAVVTVGQGGDITGFTATSVASLSARPPRLLVCVSQTSSSWQALQRHASFAVNLLSDADRLLADRFAGRDGLENAARFAGFPWSSTCQSAGNLDPRSASNLDPFSGLSR